MNRDLETDGADTPPTLRSTQPLPLNLLGLPQAELEEFFAELGERPFRARQLMRWLYHRGVADPWQMTDLSLDLRRRLVATAKLELPATRGLLRARDGTVKWRLGVGDGQTIETVYIPEPERGTLCISSQVGCVLDCPFCATGRLGFQRNLSAAEIVGQMMVARRDLPPRGEGPPITNVVFMGMGEPLSNLKAVVQACGLLTGELGFGLSRRRVTVSTAGLVPQIRRLSEAANVGLAVSLHASNDELRNELVPINRRYPIAELLQACWDYEAGAPGREITFEYVMLASVNDSEDDARRLADLLARRPAKVNLIPFNRVSGTPYRRSPRSVVQAFRQVLLDRGIVTVTRRPRGEDIDAACGQLAGCSD